MLIFGENRKISRELCAKLQSLGYGVEVLSVAGGNLETAVEKAAQTLNHRQLILAFRNEELKNVSALFHKKGIDKLSVCPWDTHFTGRNNEDLNNFVFRVDNRKPRLDYLEIEVSESCNLNCKGCNEFSNLVEENMFGDLQQTERDLGKLKDYFWGVGKIRLMGGEPLVNPDYIRFVKTAREIFPDSDIRILTNGLLVPKLKKDDLLEIKNSNCSFDISVYPPTQRIIDTITGILREAGIPYNLSVPNKLFFKSLLKEPMESPNEAFSNCLFTHCHALSGGYISACSNQMYAHRLNTAFNLKFPNDDKIDIYNTSLTGWEMNEIFSKPHEFCRYCARGMVPYKWKAGTKSTVKAGDWLIEPSFFNFKIVPVIQKAVKSSAKRLRYILRRPKKKRYK